MEDSDLSTLPDNQSARSPSTLTIVAERLSEARANAELAELEYRRHALFAMQGDPRADEEGAETRLGLARREISRLEAIMVEATAQEVEANRAEQKMREAEEDAQLIKAYEALCKTAHVLGRKLASYTGAYAAFIEAGKAVRELGQVNRRMRQDLLWQDFDKLVSLELARVSPAQALPPGADAWAASARNVSELTPLAQEIENLMQAVRKGLNRA